MSSVTPDPQDEDLSYQDALSAKCSEYISRVFEVAWRIEGALIALDEWLESDPDEQTKQRRLNLYQIGLSHELVSVDIFIGR